MTTKNEDRQLVFLRRLVKILGVILVIGAVFVLTVAIGRLTGKLNSTNCNAPTQDIMLAQEGTIIAMEQERSQLILALKESQEQKIIFIDLCSGKLIRTLHFN